MNRVAVLAIVLLIPPAARADVLPPDTSHDPPDLEIEVGEDLRDYRLWTITQLGPKRIHLTPGGRYRISGNNRDEADRDVVIVAVPLAQVETFAEEVRKNPLTRDTVVPGTLRSGRVDLCRDVRFDRRRLRDHDVDRCRLTLGLFSDEIQVVWEDRTTLFGKLWRVIAGMYLMVGVVWLSLWVVRRVRRTTARSA